MPPEKRKRRVGDLEFIEMALAEAAKCQCEDDRRHPKVGAVAVRDGMVLAQAHRGEMEPGEHAEFTALEKKLSADSLVGATIYTTLEPCTTRNHPKVPCAQRLVERKVRRVVIGMLDPNEKICGRGLWHLRESGIETDLFPHEHMAVAEELNREFIRLHRPALKFLSEPTGAGSALAVARPAPADEDREWTLISKVFDSSKVRDFASAEAAIKELQALRTTEIDRQRLQLLFWKLKAEHGHDNEARAQLLKVAGNGELGVLATEFIASLDRATGNLLAAATRLGEAVDSADDSDTKAELAARAAEIYGTFGGSSVGIEVLRKVSPLELTPTRRSQILHAFAEAVSGSSSPVQKAALLCRAASIHPTSSNFFSAAYALAEANLHALAAIQYELALASESNNEASLNNLAVAFDKLSLPGMAVQHYRKAAELGNTLAMANLAQQYIAGGFFHEADVEVKRGRTAEEPHENIGAAMVALANAKSEESKRWTEQRKMALSQKSFFDELADALTSTPSPSVVRGSWIVSSSCTATLDLVGSAAEAAWEESSEKRRFKGEVIGRALLGSLEQWHSYWTRWEVKGTLAMILREDGTLSGVVLGSDGTLRPIEWTRPS
jgi:pyrimidine deaminase RibD-like protein/TPR repeat protein